MDVNGRPDYMDGGMAGMDMGMGMNGMNGRGQNYRPPERRGICRDYHSAFFNFSTSPVLLS